MPKSKQEKLTEEQLNETLNYFEVFSQAYANVYGNVNPYALYRNHYFTPALINSAMQSINMNPQIPKNTEDITVALENPKSSETILRNYATHFELNNHFYKRLIQFNADLLAWNLTFDCTNIEKPEDFESEEFKKDLAVVNNFCANMNFKREGRIIVDQILRQGVYYGVLRDEATRISFQELSPDYCKITGRSNYGYLFSFDLSYFINNAGHDINMFPKVFKRLLRQIYEQIGETYKPASKVDNRHSSFVYDIDVSPKDGFWCFTLDNGLATLVPYYSSLFSDLYLQPLMRELEKNKAMISAQKLLVGIIETQETSKAGNTPNQVKISPKTMGEFLALARKALDKSIGITTLPVKEVEVVDFNVEAQSRYTNYQRNISANSIASSASMLTDNKLNAFESELALDIDANFVKSLYGQFENFIEYYINSKTEKFKFKFRFHDINTKSDHKSRSELFEKMASKGLVDINLYARATDQNVFEAIRSLQFTKSLKIEDCLVSLISLTNQSPKAGRPENTQSTNDSTLASRERGSNLEKEG